MYANIRFLPRAFSFIRVLTVYQKLLTLKVIEVLEKDIKRLKKK